MPTMGAYYKIARSFCLAKE